MNSVVVKHIVIVGGGTAGWLTACIIAAQHQCIEPRSVQITLIESTQVSSIGVGEGTWPTMRSTLQDIGISEVAFLSCCDATFKQGSEFIGWLDGCNSDHYFHPFTVPFGLGKANLSEHWQQFAADSCFADCVSFQPQLCRLGLAPKQAATPEYAAVANYGYHLNAAKFADLLKEHATKRLGVVHLSAHVKAIQSSPCRHISAVETDQGLIEGQFFIDCSGMTALLLGGHYGVPLVAKQDILFNDTALATQIPYQSTDSPIASHTLSTAQANGWIWEIGLPSRCGIGHVYSSQHSSDDEAEIALRKYISKKPELDKSHSPQIRKISFKPGHREKFWVKNCVAVGMAAGFIEPLEASALALVELSARMISQELPANLELMDICAKRFNQRFSYRWQRIIEFLKLHYVLSRRSDSAYWLDNRDTRSIPDRLRELLNLWRYQPPGPYDFTDAEEIFPSSSYQYILYGMGFETLNSHNTRRYGDFNSAEYFYQENSRLTQRYVNGLQSNRELLKHILAKGLPRH